MLFACKCHPFGWNLCVYIVVRLWYQNILLKMCLNYCVLKECSRKRFFAPIIEECECANYYLFEFSMLS